MTHTETFTITVNNINDAPTFTTPSLVLKTNEAKPLKLAASDEDNDALVYSIFLAPKLGKASINAQTGELNYRAPAIPASEKIGVRISDGKTNADMTINVLVNQANRAPVVKNQSFTTKNNAAIKGRITGSDADNHRLTYRLLKSPKSGKLFVKSDGLYSYIPDAKFVGKVSFSIVANDGFMDSQPANYSITVQQGVVVLPTHTKYMSGYPDGQFKPNQGVTRAEVAAAVVRLTGAKGKVPAKSSYTDVKTSNWYFAPLEIALQNKWMSGRLSGAFEPEAALTRTEMQQLVSRLIATNAVKGSTHSLKSLTIPWLVKDSKLLSNRSTLPVKRSEAVVIFNRLFERGPLYGYNKQVWRDVPVTHPNFRDIQEASVTHEAERRNGVEYFVRLK